MARLILASRSPQRRAILEQLGIAFSIQIPDVDELTTGQAEAVVVENARRKAAVVAGASEDGLVLGVDTVVCLGSRIYGKPSGEDQARDVLSALSDRRHSVISGICLIDAGQARSAVASTAVEFRKLDQELIEWYVRSGEWRERAGAYAIQGRGAALVRRIEGDYWNVVGLPVCTLLELAPEVLGTE